MAANMNNSELEETLAQIAVKLERLETSNAQFLSRLDIAIDYLNTLAVLAVTANDAPSRRRNA
jgi:hypothetical protein